MPYYIISIDDEEVCCCQEENYYSAEEGAVKVLDRPLIDIRIREVSEAEADTWSQEWLQGEIRVEDLCPICNGARASIVVGDIIMKECKLCGFKS